MSLPHLSHHLLTVGVSFLTLAFLLRGFGEYVSGLGFTTYVILPLKYLFMNFPRAPKNIYFWTRENFLILIEKERKWD